MNPVDERDATIETRGPQDFRVHLWTGPAVLEEGSCAAFDLDQTDALAAIEWATHAADSRRPCVAEVLLKRTHTNGELETVALATIFR